MAESRSRPSDAETGQRLELVDCDVHPFHVGDEIEQYLPQDVRDRHGITLPHGYWSNPHEGFRGDAKPETGGIPGSDPALLREDLMGEEPTTYPILNAAGILLFSASPQRGYAQDLATAYNEWFLDKWLSFDDRFCGSIVVAPQQPERAAEEIRRLGDHPQVRQVLMGSATETPLGRETYWPIYEAATDHDLPVAVHPGSVGHGLCPPPTGAGYPSTFYELHTIAPAHYFSQLVSLVADEVFVEYPDLDFVFIEGGFTWALSAMWRLDRNWERLPDDVSGLASPPSEYVKEHCWFGTQPIPEPDDWNQLLRLMDMMDAEEMLLYCSDYPHWDTDSLEHGLPNWQDPLRSQVQYENAKQLYDLPDRVVGLR